MSRRRAAPVGNSGLMSRAAWHATWLTPDEIRSRELFKTSSQRRLSRRINGSRLCLRRVREMSPRPIQLSLDFWLRPVASFNLPDTGRRA